LGSVVLDGRNLDKRYGATHALRDVSITVPRGVVHGIIGENGAGKSTFIKIVSGLERQDSGSLALNGREYRPRNIEDARSHGVWTAFQELGLLPNLSVAENLLMPSLRSGPRKSPFVARKANEQAVSETLANFGLEHIPPGRAVEMLPLAERQKLEIVRAISHNPELLLLDEPTAALPDPEWLFDILRKLKAKSPDLTVLYISHRLNEIESLCESSTVLCNGAIVKTLAMKDADRDLIMSLMAGSREGKSSISSELASREAAEARRIGRKQGVPSVKVDGLSGGKVRNVSFTLHKGEILGVAGLGSQGQREVFRMLAGVDRAGAGTVEIDGKIVKMTSPTRALRAGVCFVPEDRKVEGLLPGLRTLHNVSIASLSKVMTLGIIRRKKEYAAGLAPSSLVDLSPEYLTRDVDALSGGNQQKAVVARSLMREATNLLLYDPSRGVDVGTKASLYDMMRHVTDQGISILWYSTDLWELTSVCDRILCFYGGAIVAEMDGGAPVEGLMHAITGLRAADRTQQRVAGETSTAGSAQTAEDGGQ
jgi:ribose transport system ATP-binding protein